MFVWTNLVITIAEILEQVLQLYTWIVIASAILTWVEPNPYNPIVRFINSITEPVFDWVRAKLPVMFSGIDFSPLVVIFGIVFIRQYLIPTLTRLAVSGFS